MNHVHLWTSVEDEPPTTEIKSKDNSIDFIRKNCYYDLSIIGLQNDSRFFRFHFFLLKQRANISIKQNNEISFTSKRFSSCFFLAAAAAASSAERCKCNSRIKSSFVCGA